MSERDGVFSHHDHQPTSLTLVKVVLLDSVKIFLRNKQTFLSIFALTTLPLSLLLFSLSLPPTPSNPTSTISSPSPAKPPRASRPAKSGRSLATTPFPSSASSSSTPSHPTWSLSSLQSPPSPPRLYPMTKAPESAFLTRAAVTELERPLATSICIYLRFGRVRPRAPHFSFDIRLARLQVFHPRYRVGSGDLPNGGYGVRPRRLDSRREVRLGCDPSRFGFNGGQEAVRVGFVRFLRDGDGGDC
ncbi:hypothetical protein M0R45_019232 [Rubus argutus]|uniref:Uncharacterized protein n=1 Tax=Rubus argutus TaxID=59490 RepID=A0AAW1X7C1_RUBAR